MYASCGVRLGQIITKWDKYGTNMGQIWDKYGTNMGQIWDFFQYILAQLILKSPRFLPFGGEYKPTGGQILTSVLAGKLVR